MTIMDMGLTSLDYSSTLPPAPMFLLRKSSALNKLFVLPLQRSVSAFVHP